MSELIQTPFSAGGWFTGERARAWCRVLAVGEILWLAAHFAQGFASKHPASALINTDFLCFWSAGTLTLRSGAAAAYDRFAMAALEHAMQVFGANLVAPFLYPPTYLLLCVLLAMLPLIPAAVVFVVAGAVPYLMCLRRLLPQRWAILPTIAFPGLLVTAGTQQNGFLSAACFGGAALLLESRPFLAGACLGLLTCKPHLSLLVPVSLIAAKRWRVLAGAACSACFLFALSLLCFGTASWWRFPQATRTALGVLAGNLTDLSKMQSVFGAALILHAPPALGLALQALAAASSVAVLAATARRRPGGTAEMAMLAAATLFASPYLMDYDLAVLGIPLAWMARDANRTGWLPWEKYAAMAAYMMPMFTRGIALNFGVPLAPAVLAAFLFALAGRTEGRTSFLKKMSKKLLFS